MALYPQATFVASLLSLDTLVFFVRLEGAVGREQLQATLLWSVLVMGPLSQGAWRMH